VRYRAPVCVVAIGLIVAAVAACGGTAPTSVPAGDPTSAPTLTPTLPQVPLPAGSAAVATPTASTSPAASPGVAYDESLLGILPAEIDGLQFEPDPEALAQLDDKALDAAADRIAFAVISDVESGELAVTSVLHLKAGAFGDAFFRAYRDSYDAAACEPAGGKSGNAEAEIAGHKTFIGTCGSGAHTYHVYLPNQQTIVSVVSVGETRKFGERIVEGLRG
jgi:hypothetical protein